MKKSDLLIAIEDWEESVKWIEYGWDCIEEYTHDLMSREFLDEEIQKAFESEVKLYLSRIEEIDRRFINVTYSGECVWSQDIEIKYGYSPEKNWYYYRWQKK